MKRHDIEDARVRPWERHVAALGVLPFQISGVAAETQDEQVRRNLGLKQFPQYRFRMPNG